MAFLNLSKTILPRQDKQHGYPLDLDGSLRFTRPFSIDMFPYPTPIGMVQGFMRQNNPFIWEQAARKPFGPNINTVLRDWTWQVAVPGLTKVGA